MHTSDSSSLSLEFAGISSVNTRHSIHGCLTTHTRSFLQFSGAQDICFSQWTCPTLIEIFTACLELISLQPVKHSRYRLIVYEIYSKHVNILQQSTLLNTMIYYSIHFIRRLSINYLQTQGSDYPFRKVY